MKITLAVDESQARWLFDVVQTACQMRALEITDQPVNWTDVTWVQADDIREQLWQAIAAADVASGSMGRTDDGPQDLSYDDAVRVLNGEQPRGCYCPPERMHLADCEARQ